MEAALATPVVVMLIFGLIELVLLSGAALDLSDAAAEAARAGSIGASAPDADRMILDAIVEHRINGDLDRIDFVVVYQSAEPGSPPNPACLQQTSNRYKCNRYGPEAFDQPFSIDGRPNPLWGCGPGALDRGWCPTTRRSYSGESGWSDRVAVYIHSTHSSVVGMPWASRSLTEIAEATVEP